MSENIPGNVETEARKARNIFIEALTEKIRGALREYGGEDIIKKISAQEFQTEAVKKVDVLGKKLFTHIKAEDAARFVSDYIYSDEIHEIVKRLYKTHSK